MFLSVLVKEFFTATPIYTIAMDVDSFRAHAREAIFIVF